MRIIISVVSVLLMLPLFGCSNDDLKVYRRFLTLSYTGDGEEELFRQKVSKVNIYIYDRDGILVDEIVLNRAQLDKYSAVYLNLPQGKYRAVLWGNAHGDTEINNEAELSSGIVGVPNYFAGGKVATNDSLYYGSHEFEMADLKPKTDIVKFNSVHMGIHMLFSGFGHLLLPEGGALLGVEVRGVSPAVDFEGRYAEETVTYYPEPAYNETSKEFNARLNILRGADTDGISVHLVNTETSEEIYRLSLGEFMEEHEIGPDDLVGIRFRFDGTDIVVSQIGG